MIICITAMVYFFLSSYLTSSAEGGLLGIEQALPDIGPDSLDSRRLDQISESLFTYMKILTCATIACIQLQERTLMETFMILSFVIAGVIAPVAMAWIKGDGWLERLGFKDSTGAAVVYMCGGVCGFVGNVMLGPRFSIFSKSSSSNLKKNNQQMQRQFERVQRRDARYNNDARQLMWQKMTQLDTFYRSDSNNLSTNGSRVKHAESLAKDNILATRPYLNLDPISRAPSFFQPQNEPIDKHTGSAQSSKTSY